MNQIYPFSTRALRVIQPLGSYYVAVIPANILLDVAFSDRLRANRDDRDGYRVDGTQRAISNARHPQIEDYIKRTDSAFPNTIILAANYDAETGHIRTAEMPEDDLPKVDPLQTLWVIKELDDGCFELTIPTPEKLAGIIDGQHRLDGFSKINDPDRKNMELICSIFMELSKPYQAQLFATINSTQKQVDKSLTYELFGYNIDEEPEEKWTPDKLAVFLTRRLNTQEGSPLRGRISISPRRDQSLADLNSGVDWHVSTATIVEGILRLISANPRRDTNAMLTKKPGDRGILRNGAKDRSPMREIYLGGNDNILFTTVLNYLKACDDCFWAGAGPDSFITKTVGVQALFDILRKIAPNAIAGKDISIGYFKEILGRASHINYAEIQFKNASGSGRSLIRRTIEDAISLG